MRKKNAWLEARYTPFYVSLRAVSGRFELAHYVRRKKGMEKERDLDALLIFIFIFRFILDVYCLVFATHVGILMTSQYHPSVSSNSYPFVRS